MTNRKCLGIWCLVLVALCGCQDPPIPKPKGYFRVDMPLTSYAEYQHPCGPAFDVPVYAKIEKFLPQDERDISCWFNCAFPPFHAKLHCTYVPIQSAEHFSQLVNEAHQMVFQHEQKASGISTQQFYFPEHSVSGLLFDLDGAVASPLQFFTTDSSEHFLRGSLYFSHVPNPDSLRPSLMHVRENVVQLIETMTWTNNPKP